MYRFNTCLMPWVSPAQAPSAHRGRPVPTSMGSRPCMEVASPMAVPALSWTGTTPGALSLTARAAARMSSHETSYQSADNPAFSKTVLL